MELFIIISSITLFIIHTLIIPIVLNKNKLCSQKYLQFSVIIAAKNKEKDIISLLEPLKKLNYPQENYEIIIVDDGSIDDTFNLLIQNSKSFENIKILKAEGKKYSGKKGALQIGIENSKFPFVLITDADCIVNENWLNSYSNKFSQGYDLLFGVAPYVQTNLFLNKIICFENLRGHILTFFFAKIGLPYSAAARNLGFKKSSFEKVGGYKNTLDTLSGDDDLLIREFKKHKLKISVVEEQGSEVFTHSKNKMKDFLFQRGRHTSSSNYYSFYNKIILFFWHSINILFLFSFFLVPLNYLFFIPSVVKILCDIILVKLLQKKFYYKFNIFEIVVLQFIYELLLVVHFINGQFKKNKW